MEVRVLSSAPEFVLNVDIRIYEDSTYGVLSPFGASVLHLESDSFVDCVHSARRIPGAHESSLPHPLVTSSCATSLDSWLGRPTPWCPNRCPERTDSAPRRRA